jgi:uncharacterized membrane protein
MGQLTPELGFPIVRGTQLSHVEVLMTRHFPVRTLTTTGLLLAVGVLLPLAFHAAFGQVAGRTLLPLHYAVLLGGLLLGPVAGAFLGIATPLLSTVMTGMPAVTILPPMIVELAVYGLVAGLAHRRWKLAPLWSLCLAMVAGRVGLGLAVALLGSAGDHPAASGTQTSGTFRRGSLTGADTLHTHFTMCRSLHLC